jgi:hypothetical protein
MVVYLVVRMVEKLVASKVDYLDARKVAEKVER